MNSKRARSPFILGLVLALLLTGCAAPAPSEAPPRNRSPRGDGRAHCTGCNRRAGNPGPDRRAREDLGRGCLGSGRVDSAEHARLPGRHDLCLPRGRGRALRL